MAFRSRDFRTRTHKSSFTTAACCRQVRGFVGLYDYRHAAKGHSTAAEGQAVAFAGPVVVDVGVVRIGEMDRRLKTGRWVRSGGVL